MQARRFEDLERKLQVLTVHNENLDRNLQMVTARSQNREKELKYQIKALEAELRRQEGKLSNQCIEYKRLICYVACLHLVVCNTSSRSCSPGG